MIRINGEKIVNMEMFHDQMTEQFNFPEYYGRNLDALWDLVTTEGLQETILIEQFSDLYQNLGRDALDILQLFLDAAKEKDITVILMGGVC